MSVECYAPAMYRHQSVVSPLLSDHQDQCGKVVFSYLQEKHKSSPSKGIGPGEWQCQDSDLGLSSLLQEGGAVDRPVGRAPRRGTLRGHRDGGR